MSRTASRQSAEQLLQMTPGELVAWEQPQAMRLRVLAGLVWVTRERDLGDYFLHAGESLALHPNRRTLIQAERVARLVVEPVTGDRPGPRSGRGRRTLERWLQSAPVAAGVALGAP